MIEATRWARLVLTLLIAVASVGCQPPPTSPAARRRLADTPTSPAEPAAQDRVAWGRLPLTFVENRGQTDPRVALHADLGPATAFFTPGGLTLALRGSYAAPGADAPPPGAWALRLDLVGADPESRPVGVDRTEGIVSYLKGPAEQWVAAAPAYAGVAYRGVWPGIDLIYGQQDRQLKYSFAVQPGADPARIVVEVAGATDARLLEDGSLEVSTPLGGFRDLAPTAFQDVDGRRSAVDVAFYLEADPEAGTYRYGFRLGEYDRSQPLLVDPIVLLNGTFLGGDAADYARAIAVDGSGNAYVVGQTFSAQTTFPNGTGFSSLSVPGIDQTHSTSDFDAFVVKLNAAGTGLVYATYLGGTGYEDVLDVTVDPGGHAHVAGVTGSTEATFPVTQAFDPTHNGGQDAFVVKLNTTGTGLLFSTFIGGSFSDRATGVALDRSNNVYISRTTGSNEATFPNGQGFAAFTPALPGFDQTHNRRDDGFVAKLNVTGTIMAYVTYIGGDGDDGIAAIAVDNNGSAYVAGGTSSDRFSFPNGVGFAFLSIPGFDQTSADQSEAFVAKLNATGTALEYATYIHGDGIDFASTIAVDASGAAVVAGGTSSPQTSFPNGQGLASLNPAVPGFDQTFDGLTTLGWVAQLNTSGTGLLFLTYLGGNNLQNGSSVSGIALDSAGRVHVVGNTSSSEATFPNGQGLASVPVPGFDQTFNGLSDGFVVILNASGTSLEYATYLGGSHHEFAAGIALSGSGNIYVAGDTISTSTQSTFPNGQGFASLSPPVPGFDQTSNGVEEAFVVTLGEGSSQPVTADVELVSKVDTPDPVTVGQPLTYTLTVRNNGPARASGISLTDTLPGGATFASASAGCAHAAGTVTCELGALDTGATATVTVVVIPGAAGTLVNSASVVSTSTDPAPGNNAAQASTTVQADPAVSCAPRPPVVVRSEVVTDGGVSRLRVTVAAQTSAQVPVNALTSVEFTRLDNARVSVLPGGPNNQVAPFVQNLPGGTTRLQFEVFRSVPGAPVTVHLVAHDACGAWPTFVGAGGGVPI